MNLEFNKFQTPITEEALNTYPKEVQEQFMDAITTIPFIKSLVRTDRIYARDLERDSSGKIIIDITKPHILEDMDYFRPSALHFKKYGTYTNLSPNGNPNSEYGKWLREEIRRCYEGYVRESDGEWITGDYYFFLNYCPIQISKKEKNSKKSQRIIDFPKVWEGHYYLAHYLEQARNNGNHAFMLAARGKGKAHPYSQKVLTLDGWKKWGDLHIGDYVYGDNGEPTKIIDIPFDDECSIYNVTLRDGRVIQCSDGHLFKVKDYNKHKIYIKSLKEIMLDYKRKRVATKNCPNGVEYNYRIPKISNYVNFKSKQVPIDPYTLGLMIGDGCFRNSTAKNYIIFTCDKNDISTYKNNVPYEIDKITNDVYTYCVRCNTEYLRNVNLWGLKSEDKFIPSDYLYNDYNVRINLLKGLMDSDGTVDKTSGIPILCTTSERLKNDFEFLCRSLGFNISTSVKIPKYNNKEYLKCYSIRVVTNVKIFNLERKQKLVNKFNTGYSKSTKDYTAIVNIKYSHKEKAKCITVDNESHCYIVGDFVVTHNSYFSAARVAKRFVLGESKEVNKKVQCVVTASERKYIQGANQILDMFSYYIDFLANNTQFPRKRLVNSLHDMQWTMGYVDASNGTKKGTLNSVTGVTSKDDESKLRGSRGQLYVIEEAGCHLKGTEVRMYDGSIKKVEDIIIGDILMGDDGTPRNVLELYSGIDNMYKITLSNGDYQIVNSKHPVIYKTYDWNKKIYTEHLSTAPELMKMNTSKGYYISKSDAINYPYQNIIIDPYWLGLWLGDGDATRMSISNEDIEVLDWLEYYCNSYRYEYTKRYLPQSKRYYNFNISAKNKVLQDEFKRLGLKNNKHIPDCYKYNSRKVVAKVIAGLIDTNGSYDCRRHCYEIKQLYTRKNIIYDIKEMCEYLGLRCTVSTRLASKKAKGAGHIIYRLRIRGNYILPVKIARKKQTLRSGFKNKKSWTDYSFKVEEYGIGEYYGFTIDKNNLFLLKDYTIVHNTFPRLLQLYAVLRPSVEDGSNVFGQIFGYGTSGDSESDFSSMQEIMYNPKGYNIKSVENVYDVEGKGRKEFTYFFPSYLNMADCYDDNGNSDVTKALLEILKDRYIVKYNSTDIKMITKRIAELPITPAEAILQTVNNLFPVSELQERLLEIDNNPSFFNDVYVGDLYITNKGEVEFKPSTDTPIRDFKVNDNDIVEGALEIFEMPIKDSSHKVPQGRYIIGHDPVDNDENKQGSLSSSFVFDTWTDRIVAEYTGRMKYSDDNFEILRRLCIFYNAKCLYEQNIKGCFAYFSQKNCLYMLADTPEYLLDKQLIKNIGYGNTSKGVRATQPINNYANKLIQKWMVRPIVKTVQQDGQTIEVQVPNLFNIKNRALIKECICYNPLQGNYDRIRALGLVMLYREEFVILNEGLNHKEVSLSNYIGNDDFFVRNYKNHYTYNNKEFDDL